MQLLNVYSRLLVSPIYQWTKLLAVSDMAVLFRQQPAMLLAPPLARYCSSTRSGKALSCFACRDEHMIARFSPSAASGFPRILRAAPEADGRGCQKGSGEYF